MRQEACQNATRHVRNYVRISLRSGQGQKSHKLFQVFQGRSCRWWVGSKTRLRAGAKFIRIVATPNEMDLCCPISRQRPPGGWGNREIFRPTAIGSGTDMRPTAMAMIRPRDADARPTALQPDSPAGNRLRLPSSRHRRSLPDEQSTRPTRRVARVVAIRALCGQAAGSRASASARIGARDEDAQPVCFGCAQLTTSR